MLIFFIWTRIIKLFNDDLDFEENSFLVYGVYKRDKCAHKNATYSVLTWTRPGYVDTFGMTLDKSKDRITKYIAFSKVNFTLSNS